MKGDPQAIVFDFDGVLVHSEPLHFWAMHEALGEEKIELTEAEYYQHLIGCCDRDGFRRLLQLRSLEAEPKLLLKLMAAKSERIMDLIYRRKFTALPGVEELVRALWRHYPLGICSGGARQEIEAMLEAINLRDCFPTIIAAEDCTEGKPDPQGYFMALHEISRRIKNDLTPADALIVEDAPAVIASVKAAGFSVLGVAGTCSARKLAQADWVVEKLDITAVAAQLPRLRLSLEPV